MAVPDHNLAARNRAHSGLLPPEAAWNRAVPGMAQSGDVRLYVRSAAARTLGLARPRRWRFVQRLNDAVMTVYLWHFAPVLIVAAAFYPTGVMPQPAIGSAPWWVLRLAWFGLLTALLVPMTTAVMWAERPMLGLPAGIGPPRRWSPALLLAGLAASLSGLSQLAVAGFAPEGYLLGPALADCAVGLAAILFSGRVPRRFHREVPKPSH